MASSSSYRSTIRVPLTALALAVTAFATVALGGRAQGADAPKGPSVKFVAQPDDRVPRELPGEVVVRLAVGVDGQTFAANVGLEFKRRLRFAPNTYVFGGVHGDPNAAAAQLRQVPGVIDAVANLVYVSQSLPAVDANDPIEPQQWALDVIEARPAWGITVGERFVDGPREEVLVGLLDDPIQISHPDLAENIDPNGFDFLLDQPYDESVINTTFFGSGHGTNMAGCVAAVTNNNEGIASIPWEGVKILPCRIADFIFFTDDTVFSLQSTNAIVDAIYYCIQQGCDVINMSFVLGFGGTDPLVAQAIRDAYNQGIVVVGAAGNFRQFIANAGVQFPANLPEVIAVGSVGPSGERAQYSSGGPELELMGPGGNSSNFFSASDRQVITTDNLNNTFNFFNAPPGYTYTQGTSVAAAYVSGAIATLITQGARDETLSGALQVEAIRSLMRRTARNPFGQRNDEFGFGVINFNAALRAITHYIDIIAPSPNEVTSSFSEPVEARIVQPIGVPLQGDEFVVFQNGEDVTDLVEVIDPNTGLIRYEPDVDRSYSIGSNSINIEAANVLRPDEIRSLEGPAVGRIPERAYRFRVLPHVETPGLKMFSVPYELQEDAASLPFIFGGASVKLARWIPERSRYAIFDPASSPQDPEASLTGTASGVARPPVGIGFWVRLSESGPPPAPDGGGTEQVLGTQLQILGNAVRAPFYEIPIKPGFNMVGNPFPFRVPWNVVNVRFGQETMSVTEAARRNLMSNAIWRYVDGRYVFQALPNGELVDWESHWVRSFEELTLIVPRVPAQINQAASLRSAGSGVQLAGGWTRSLKAVAGGEPAGKVTVGAAGGGRNGYGPEDRETPPPLLGSADFRVRNGNWGRYSGAYQQDIRSLAAAGQRWTLEVETSRPGTPVKLTWDRFPPGTEAFLRVGKSRQVIDLRKRSAVQFTAARAGVQQVNLFVRAAPGA